MAKALILGIDPGTSVGCCALDLNGQPVAIWSKKEYGLGNLIKDALCHGRVIAVGTDKRKVPRFVHDAAVKLGARVFAPRNDLPLSEKRALGGNAHESDAIASARYAYNQLLPLIRRVRRSVEHLEGVTEEQLLFFLVTDSRISISRAIEILTSPVEKDIEEAEQAVASRQFSERNFLSLLSRLKRALRDSQLLKKRIAALEASREKPLTIFRAAPMSEQMRFKEERIRSLSSQAAMQEERTAALGREVAKLEGIIGHASQGLVAKKLANLGIKEFSAKEKLLNLSQGDLLIVESCTEFSRDVVERLNGSVVMAGGTVPAMVRERLTVIKRTPSLFETEHFALVPTDAVEQELRSSSMLSDIISRYRNERQRQ